MISAKRAAIFSLLLLSACFSSGDSGQIVFQKGSQSKQKQKIGWLEKQKEIAEKNKKNAEEEVERLATEIHQAKLTLIRKLIDQYEIQIADFLSQPQKNARLFQLEISHLFLEEREILHQIIQEGPSPSAFEAQVELDRILRMITELSEQQEKLK